MQARVRLLAKRRLLPVAAQLPFGFAPRIRCGGAHDTGQIQTFHGRCLTRANQRLIHQFLTDHLAGRQPQDAAILRTMGAQLARQFARVQAGNGDCARAAQVVGQGAGATEIGGYQGQIADDESSRLHLVRLLILGIDAVIADVRIGERDDLLAITRVGQDFLVTGHSRIENHLANAGAGGTDGFA